MAQRAFTNLVLLALAIGLIASVAEAQTTLYVDDGAGENNEGQSWHAPYRDLESALVWASEHPIITEIHVAGGVYFPSGESELGVPRSKTFQLVNGVAILGGHAGLADPGDPDARDLGLYESILSGDLDGNDAPVACTQDSPDCDAHGGLCVDAYCILAQNLSENSYHVVTASNTDTSAVLDGFTITAGNADKDDTGSADSFGGGLLGWTSCYATVRNCTFSGNSAYWMGGGIWTTHATVTDCRVVGNSASYGGGMSSHYDSSPTFVDCTFTHNHAEYGGGIYINSGTARITGCVFSSNTATLEGGAIRLHEADGAITDCTFSDNSALLGGGMINQASSPTVTNCTFSGNSAGQTGNGGGMYSNTSSPTVTNCTFSGNAAGYGGGMYNVNPGSPTVTNCTFSANAAIYGGAMYSYNSNPTVTNSILWGDTPDEIYDDGPGTTTVTYSDVEDGWCGAGGNNIIAHPRFIRDPDDGGDGWGVGDNDDYGDLRLRPGSPAIDVGNNAAVLPGMTTDLAGNPRLVDAVDIPDTGNGDPPLVDAGAYEFQATIVGDLNGDGDVDLSDFRMFMENFGGPLLMR